MATEKKNKYKSKLKDNLVTNTSYSIAFHPFIPEPDINRRAHFNYKSGFLQASSANNIIGTSIPTKKMFSRKEYYNNFDKKIVNKNTIKNNSNLSTNINRPFGSNSPDLNSNEINNKENNYLKPTTILTTPNINKNISRKIRISVTKNNDNKIVNSNINEKIISNKIKNHIERKLNGQLISDKLKISHTFRAITYKIFDEEGVDSFLYNKRYTVLKTSE
ncbi:hypothetical protein O181_018413 [Austropuccinia psidii MF-1]|uniref:Uncharacterized protein n=1 Tax=Austropuccinia psidii MF-1 TaxID=1389203 RepID=A0A9Q3C7V4_9BASI|nr:hypothetical protein [Austropuccinia psidii MF-1]